MAFALRNLLKHDRLHTRAIDSFVDHPGLTEQLLRVQGLSATSWSPPSIKEAMGNPAVFRAVTLIANTTGSLTMEGWRNGALMASPPSLISRPGVFTTPRDFWRDTAYCLASRGEYLWWVVDRDEFGIARKLLLLPPHEVSVAWNQNFPLVREYSWRNKDIPSDDIVHGTFATEPGGLRGIGPLQMCGAALSVAVEADEWAARFFAKGGAPSVIIKYAGQLSPAEAATLKDQWLERESNEVRVVDQGGEPAAFQIDPESAQLLESRQHSKGDVATMFGINGHLLNYTQAGSSLTYQNIGQAFDDFVRTSLAPGYLEPIEHGVSDLLTRTTVGRFNLQALLRADVKTQAEVFSTLVTAGMPQAQAAGIAGIGTLVDMQPIPDSIGTVSREMVPSA